MCMDILVAVAVQGLVQGVVLITYPIRLKRRRWQTTSANDLSEFFMCDPGRTLAMQSK